MIYTVLRFLSFVILKLVFRLKVKGREFIPKEGGFILASNHISYLDPIIVGVASSRKLNYLAKAELFAHSLSRWFLSSINVFAVKRESTDISALKEAIRRIKKGGGLLLFPEGRRREQLEPEVKPQEGVGFLAAKLNVPVIPAFVKGSEKALPKGARFILLSKILVYFGPPVEIKKDMPYQDIAQLVMQRINELEKNTDKGGK